MLTTLKETREAISTYNEKVAKRLKERKAWLDSIELDNIYVLQEAIEHILAEYINKFTEEFCKNDGIINFNGECLLSILDANILEITFPNKKFIYDKVLDYLKKNHDDFRFKVESKTSLIDCTSELEEFKPTDLTVNPNEYYMSAEQWVYTYLYYFLFCESYSKKIYNFTKYEYKIQFDEDPQLSSPNLSFKGKIIFFF